VAHTISKIDPISSPKRPMAVLRGRHGMSPLRKISTLTFFVPTRALLQLREMDQVCYRRTMNGWDVP